MSRYKCVNCQPCKDRNYPCCDYCSAGCCQDCKRNHDEIFYLSDKFRYKVNEALSDLTSKSYSVKNNLTNYSVYLSYYGGGIYYCENFLNSMRNRYNDLCSQNSRLANDIYNENNEFCRNCDRLSNQHQIDMKRISNDYSLEMERINNCRTMENKNKAQIDSLKENKKELEKEKNKINMDEIINNFIEAEKKKEEKEFILNKNNIDKENEVEDKKLEYTQEEINLKNSYLDDIKKIKNYSGKIPYFENWINMYNLNKYIN